MPEKPTAVDLRKYFLFAAFRGHLDQEYRDRSEVLLGENPSPEFYGGVTRLGKVDRDTFLAFDQAIDPWTKPNGGVVDKTYLFQCAPDNRPDNESYGCGHMSLRFGRNVSVPGLEQPCERCGDLTPYDRIPAVVWGIDGLFRNFEGAEIELALWFDRKAEWVTERGSAKLSDNFVEEYAEFLGGKITGKNDTDKNDISYDAKFRLCYLRRINGTERLLREIRIKGFFGRLQDLVLMGQSVDEAGS